MARLNRLDFLGMTQGLDRFVNQISARKQQEQEVNKAIQMMILQAQIKQQFDPEAQFRQQMLSMFGGGQGLGQQAPQQTANIMGRGQIPVAPANFNQGGMAPQGQPQMGGGGGFKPKSFTYGGVAMERQPSEEEFNSELARKLKEKTTLQRGGGKILVSPMVNKISSSEDAYSTLGQAVTSLEGNKDRFSQFMGPGKGPLRNPIRSYVNKDLQDFLAWKANVQDAFQQYRVAITGAQASDKEIALLAKNRPTEADTYDVFIKKANSVRGIGNQVLTRYIVNLGRAGYDVSGYQDLLDSLNSDFSGFGNENLNTNNGQQNLKTSNQGADRQLDKNTAMQFLQRAGGDKNKARALAKQMGYQF